MINKKIASEVAVGTVLILAIAIGGIFWAQNEKDAVINNQQIVINDEIQKPAEKKEVACTMEVKLCDDGSFVSRTGPNCEFAECSIINAYRNDKFGFEFRYPSDFKITVDDYTDSELLKNKDKVLVYVDEANAKDGDIFLDLRMDKFQPLEDNSKLKVMTGYWYQLRVTKTSIAEIDKYISVWERKFKQNGGGVVDSRSLLGVQDVVIGGINAKKLSFDGSNLVVSSIIFIRDGYAYDLDLNTFDLDDIEIVKSTALFNETVSTFRFVK
ncbi:MAG: hypothetical protein US63_C0007G0011 [Candidatus Moranbacteria bacterium GW2011_GWC2_37_8]|nr:MAG: hypothetical protein US63_C0007G0011 [Candidatus Moranbacteria bacterium GW2011_GWC2_37_8]KKQ62791.1 MAG: hypothetical protein US82_C0006G0039 [Parcubacteria group bacterium GW2011_GWC1_38_22]KKQ81283.1 MAG: hypothetical protein UT03_C0007G0019 [Candidatus Moranbacteria bacterium GW2011_GWD2_38_7]